jgi:hypothetical protein
MMTSAERVLEIVQLRKEHPDEDRIYRTATMSAHEHTPHHDDLGWIVHAPRLEEHGMISATNGTENAGMISTTNGTLIVVAMWATFNTACSPSEARADGPGVGADTSAVAADIPETRSVGLDTSRVLIGLRISPVPLDFKHKNRILVGLGSYLVNATGGCNDCHTHPSYAPGRDPYQGQPTMINSAQYLAGGRQFGPITSPNITPDADGMPAGLTFQQFQDLLRTGRDEGRILQVMPWPVFANLADGDLRAIYEYLRAIPSRPDNSNPGP